MTGWQQWRGDMLRSQGNSGGRIQRTSWDTMRGKNEKNQGRPRGFWPGQAEKRSGHPLKRKILWVKYVWERSGPWLWMCHDLGWLSDKQAAARCVSLNFWGEAQSKIEHKGAYEVERKEKRKRGERPMVEGKPEELWSSGNKWQKSKSVKCCREQVRRRRRAQRTQQRGGHVWPGSELWARRGTSLQWIQRRTWRYTLRCFEKFCDFLFLRGKSTKIKRQMKNWENINSV